MSALRHDVSYAFSDLSDVEIDYIVARIETHEYYRDIWDSIIMHKQYACISDCPNYISSCLNMISELKHKLTENLKNDIENNVY